MSDIKNTLIIAGSIFVALYLLATLGYLMFRQYLRFKEKELELTVHMTELRAHLESKISSLNEKYLTTGEQWKDAHHLLLASQSKAADPSRPHKVPRDDEFLESHGIHSNQVSIDERLVFVLTPFLPEFAPAFEQVRNVCSEIGLTCKRGDEEFVSGEIFPHILKQLVKARLVIANISGRNPNVFYELGIAHALDKPVIILARHTDELPFDVRTKNVVFYSNEKNLASQLKDVLLKIFVANS